MAQKKEKKAKRKKGLRERKRPDVKGLVDVKVQNLSFDSTASSSESKEEIKGMIGKEDEFNFDPKKVKITKKILNAKLEEEEKEEEPLLSNKFLDRWRNSLDLD